MLGGCCTINTPDERDNGDSDQRSWGGDEKGSDSGRILKVDLTGPAD